MSYLQQEEEGWIENLSALLEQREKHRTIRQKIERSYQRAMNIRDSIPVGENWNEIESGYLKAYRRAFRLADGRGFTAVTRRYLKALRNDQDRGVEVKPLASAEKGPMPNEQVATTPRSIEGEAMTKQNEAGLKIKVSQGPTSGNSGQVWPQTVQGSDKVTHPASPSPYEPRLRKIATTAILRGADVSATEAIEIALAVLRSELSGTINSADKLVSRLRRAQLSAETADLVDDLETEVTKWKR